MKLDELLATQNTNISKLYLDMFDGDTNAANIALQNDIKINKPLSSLVGRKPKKLINKANLQLTMRNAEKELQTNNLHKDAQQTLLQLKKEHGIR